MKAFSRLLMVGLLVSATGVAGCEKEVTTAKATPSGSSVPTATPREDDILRLELRPLADVQMQGGKSKSGRIKAIDHQKRQIELEFKDSSSEFVSIDDIQKVTFKGEERLPKSTSSSVVRGSEILSIAPLSEFQINPQTGEAKVKRNAVIPEDRLPNPQSPKISNYLVKEMWFNKQQKETIRLKVIPIDSSPKS